MSKKPRQHWQQDNQDYTFSQYSFYLAVLGLLIVGLLVGYIYSILPAKIPQTHLVSITSRPGGELPVIPFQNEDIAALDTAFPEHQHYEFDDLDSFQQNVIEELKSDSEKFQETDTVLIWLSAIGAERGGRPVILGSARDNLIEFDVLLTALNELPVEKIILLLDAGHAYVDSSAYQDPTKTSDLNSFSRLVEEQFALHPETPKVSVLLNGEMGERPLHSIVRRRSLLAFALEKCFDDSDDVLWTLADFRDSLSDASLKWGGVVAPQIKRLESDKTELKFPRPKFVNVAKVERISDDGNGDEQPPPEPMKLAAETKQMLASLDNAWEELQSQQKRVIAPELIDSVNWESLVRQLIELSVDQLGAAQSTQAFEQSCQNIPLTLQRLDERWRETIGRLNERWKLTPATFGEEPTAVLEKREVTWAYLRAYEIQQHLPYFVAFADSLLWLYPTEEDNAVSRFRDAVMELTEKLQRHSPSQVVPFAPLQPADPSLDQYRSIVDSVKELERSEQRLRDLLSLIGENLDFQTRGFQREMVVEAFLRLPILKIHPPNSDDPDFNNKYRILSRQELKDYLTADNPANLFPRLTLSRREAAAARRVEMYRTLLTSWFGSVGSETPLSLRLQNFAYRLNPPPFNFNQFGVDDRTPQKRVVVTRRDQLLNDANYIERSPTEIDLGLDVTNTTVLVRCQLLQNGDYFEFPDGNKEKAEFPGNPTLLALIDSPPDDPGCRLHLTVVDNLDPSREPYDEFDVPIRLPSDDAVDLVVDVGGQKNIFRQDATGDPIRPFPNRNDLSCTFSLQNKWHRPRDVSISLYACASPDTRTMPGKINVEVRQKSNRSLSRKTLTQIANGQHSLPEFNAENPQPIEIVWKKPADLDGDALPIQTPHGFLCVVGDAAANAEWKYWIPVFPVENPVVSVDPRIVSDDLKLVIDRQAFFPRDLAVKLRWSFSQGQLSSEPMLLGAGVDHLEIPVIQNVSASNLKVDSFLYVDVDGWPRKYAFKFNGRQFRTVSTHDATVDVRIGNVEDAKNPDTALVELPNRREPIRFGTRSSNRTVRLTLSPNVPSDGTFLFSTATDTIRLSEAGDPLYYPREINHLTRLNAYAGIIELESQVTDHQLTYTEVGARFRIAPVLHLGARENRPAEAIPLDGDNRIEVLFDRTDPKIDSYRVSNTKPVFPQTPVRIELKASDIEGVGIDWSRDVKLYLSPRNGSLSELTGQPVPAKLLRTAESEGTFEIEAPEQLGTYTVGVAVADRVGNRDEALQANRVAFEVVAKPVPRTQKAADELKPPPPKVFTHTLSVNVTANDMSNIAGLTVALDPPDATAEVNGNTYVFKNLNGDVLYTVNVNGKIKRGIAAGDELSAQNQTKFSAKAKSSETRSMTLQLSR